MPHVLSIYKHHLLVFLSVCRGAGLVRMVASILRGLGFLGGGWRGGLQQPFSPSNRTALPSQALQTRVHWKISLEERVLYKKKLLEDCRSKQSLLTSFPRTFYKLQIVFPDMRAAASWSPWGHAGRQRLPDGAPRESPGTKSCNISTGQIR